MQKYLPMFWGRNEKLVQFVKEYKKNNFPDKFMNLYHLHEEDSSHITYYYIICDTNTEDPNVIEELVEFSFGNAKNKSQRCKIIEKENIWCGILEICSEMIAVSFGAVKFEKCVKNELESFKNENLKIIVPRNDKFYDFPINLKRVYFFNKIVDDLVLLKLNGVKAADVEAIVGLGRFNCHPICEFMDKSKLEIKEDEGGNLLVSFGGSCILNVINLLILFDKNKRIWILQEYYFLGDVFLKVEDGEIYEWKLFSSTDENLREPIRLELMNMGLNKEQNR